jgi:glycerate dehydrogenase
VESIVFLDRGTLSVPLRAPAFAHQWTDHDKTPPEALVARLSEATIAITNKVKLPREALALLPRLRLIAVAATGYDGVDVAACRERGVVVSNVPHYSRGSVPDHVFMLILALRRNLPALHAAVQDGAWQRAPHFAILDYPIHDLAGSTLGLVGYGDLASRVETLARAFGMNLLIAERKGRPPRPGRTAFEDVLRRADVLSLHAPLTPDTQGLIGKAELALMKPDALLINTARGGLVDEDALAQALQTGRLGGAGIDVLSEEPPRGRHPLLALRQPNLLVTPHVAWSSVQAQTVLADQVIRNMEAFVAGKPRNLVS